MILRQGAGLFAALAALNLLLLVRVHNESEDSLWYLTIIRDGDAAELFNPYHLIHSWLGWFAYQAAGALGYNGGPLVPVQVLNALLGALGVAVLWATVRSATRGLLPAVAAAGTVALSYGYWSYSLGADVYPLSTTALIIALAAGYYATLHPSPWTFALFGAATALAVLGHNSNALFAIVGATALILVARDAGFARAMRMGVAYAAGLLAVVVPPYLVALAIVDATSISQASDWLTAYAQSGDWGKIGLSNIPASVVGAGRAFIGGHFLFSIDNVTDLADRATGGKALREEIYLVRDYPAAVAAALLPVIVVAIAAFGWLASRWLLRPTLEPRTNTLAILTVAWLVPAIVFAFWWEPVNPEFWMAAWVPAGILLALPLDGIPAGRGRRLAWGATGALLGALLLLNLAGSIAPQLTEENDYWRVRTKWYERNVTPDDLVITNGHIQTYYMRYFTRGTVLDIGVPWLDADKDAGLAMAEIERTIDDWDGRVLVSDEVFAPASDEYSTCTEGVRPCIDVVASMNEQYGGAVTAIDQSALETVWVLEAP